MLERTYAPPPCSESEWWIRLASFASRTDVQGSRRDQPLRLTTVHANIKTSKQALRLNAGRRLYLLMLACGPRIVRWMHGRRNRSTFQSGSGLFGSRF